MIGKRKTQFGAFLRAALPPSNISADLSKVQTVLFRGLGQPAARALPPLVPFAWTDAPEDVDGIPDSVLPRGLHLTRYALVERTLVAVVEWQTRKPPSEELQEPGALLFPIGAHLVIAPLQAEHRLVDCTLEAVLPARRVILPTLPTGTARVYRLVSMELSWRESEAGLESLRYQVLSERWISERSG